MSFHGEILLLQLMIMQLGIGLALATTDQLAIAKPGCVDKCGNLSIPYPFGMTKECYLNENFLITCDNSTNPPKPYLRESSINVTHISLPQGELQILKYIARDCYTQNGSAREDNFNFSSLTFSKIFTISNTQNKFFAVGCDTYAIVQGMKDDKINYTTGCMSICEKMEYANGSCSAGAGCCEISIPKELKNFRMELNSYYNHTNVWGFNPCSYAFVADQKEFHFSASFMRKLNNTEKLPMVLDWVISNETCGVAKKNKTSYACKGNTTCHEPDNNIGYRCNCLEGYEGNPYLNGCRDIDECEDSSHECEESRHCVNTVGNYTCLCPEDYHGDGRRGGDGCIKNKLRVIEAALGVSISGGSLLLLLGGFWLYKVIRKMRKIKLKMKFFKRNGGLVLQQQMSSNEGIIEKTKIFTSKELEKATDNFNQDRILGQGGQGTVYKGMLTDGRIVAIKKSKLVDESQLEQFINEVVILSQINHRNVVNLLGCCLETNVPLLVYEFVSNGNLFELIHDQNDEFPFSWEMRLQIATEVAGAVAYLHSASSIPIYHRDIKSTNILLDDKYRAKVSDFGTSRSISIEQTHLTTLVHGTFGYLDPEYFQSSQFTEKSDVYSFGVVLAELLTGQKPISTIRSQEDKSLATYFILSLKENRLFDILDARVMKEGGKEEIKAVANIAKRCLNLNGKKRPTMKEATMELEAIRSSPMPLNSQQNFEEDEYIVELTGPMDGVSVSVSSCSDHTGASSLDVHPLLYNKV